MGQRRASIRAGDRVIKDDGGQRGIVLATKPRDALVHWGTIARLVNEDGVQVKREHRYTDWVPKNQLTRDDQPVASPDEIAERLKKMWLGDMADIGSRVEE